MTTVVVGVEGFTTLVGAGAGAEADQSWRVVGRGGVTVQAWQASFWSGPGLV